MEHYLQAVELLPFHLKSVLYFWNIVNFLNLETLPENNEIKQLCLYAAKNHHCCLGWMGTLKGNVKKILTCQLFGFLLL